MSDTVQRHRIGPRLAGAASVAAHAVVLVVCLWMLGGWAVRVALHIGRSVFPPDVPAFGAAEIVAFYEPACSACRRTNPVLDRLERHYSRYRWARVDISYPRGMKLAQEYYRHYQVPERLRRVIPTAFAGTRTFTGYDAIRAALPAYLERNALPPPPGGRAARERSAPGG